MPLRTGLIQHKKIKRNYILDSPQFFESIVKASGNWTKPLRGNGLRPINNLAFCQCL